MSRESRKFSTDWKASKKPKKQRKYRYNSPLHIRKKFTSAHLSGDLRKKYNKRSIGLKKGDKVEIMRGSFKKKQGRVDVISLKKLKVYIGGIENTKKDGTKVRIPLEPSNLKIIELNTEDKFRQKILERK